MKTYKDHPVLKFHFHFTKKGVEIKNAGNDGVKKVWKLVGHPCRKDGGMSLLPMNFFPRPPKILANFHAYVNSCIIAVPKIANLSWLLLLYTYNRRYELKLTMILQRKVHIYHGMLQQYVRMGISVRAKGAGGAAAPPEINFSGKMAKIYVIRKNFRAKFSGKEGPKFGQKIFGDVW